MKVIQSCLTLCDPMDYIVHGIFQARILEWVAFPSPGDLPNPGTEPRSPTLQAGTLPSEPPGKSWWVSNYCTIALISQYSKVMLKVLQARLQQYMNHKLPDVQAGFRKGRGTRDQIANIDRSWKKQESSRKTSTSALLITPKPLAVWITTNWGKF